MSVDPFAIQQQVVGGKLTMIGEGAFGAVFALKGAYFGLVAKISRERDAPKLQKEILALEHANILKVRAIFVFQMKTYQWCAQVFERYECDLHQYRLKNQHLLLRQITQIAHGVACGILYLELQGVRHPDLKTPNILMKNGCPVVADLDPLMRVQEDGFAHFEQECYPSWQVAPPEWLDAYAQKLCATLPPMDAKFMPFSLGTILYFLNFCRTVPWQDTLCCPPLLKIEPLQVRAITVQDAVGMQKGMEYHDYLVGALLNHNPDQRPTIQQCVAQLHNAIEPSRQPVNGAPTCH